MYLSRNVTPSPSPAAPQECRTHLASASLPSLPPPCVLSSCSGVPTPCLGVKDSHQHLVSALVVGSHGLRFFLSAILAPFSDESFNETTIHYNMDKVMENDRCVRHSRASNGKNPKTLIALQGQLEKGAPKVWKGNCSLKRRPPHRRWLPEELNVWGSRGMIIFSPHTAYKPSQKPEARDVCGNAPHSNTSWSLVDAESGAEGQMQSAQHSYPISFCQHTDVSVFV